MASPDKSGHLGAAYGASKPEDIAAVYDRWAETYEAEMASAGYRHPTIGLALLARHLSRGAAPLLDAGCGTGLLGDWLKIAGYPVVDGLDLSEGMLAVAAKKGAYRSLTRAALGNTLPFTDGAYAGVICTGVFTTGHVGPEGLDDLVRICRPGGVIVLTVKGTLWESGFAAHVEAMAKAGRLAIAEQTEPYVSMPGEAGTTPSLAVVLQVL